MFGEIICEYKREIVSEERSRVIGECKLCNGSGIVKNRKNLINGISGIKSFSKCKYAKRFDIVRKRILSNIPRKYLYGKFKKVQKNWDDIVTEFCDNMEGKFKRGIGIYLYGPNGTGKTAMLCYILRKTLIKKIPSFYITMYDLFTMIRSGFDNEFQNELSKDIMDMDFLIIDEVGKIKTTEFVVFEFENMIRRRINQRKVTALASNYTVVELQKAFGDSIISLIRGNTKTFMVGGRDLRPKVLEGKL